MKLAMNQATMLPSDVETFVAAVSKAGFDGVELRIDKIEGFAEKKGITRLVELLQSHKLELVSLNAIENFSLLPPKIFRKKLTELEKTMDACRRLGCDTVVAVPSPLESEGGERHVIERTAEALRQLALVASRHDVKVAFEFLGFANSSINTIEDAIQVLNRTRSQNVGLVVDTFHFFVSDGQLDALRQLSPEKLWIVHINDVKRLPREELQDQHRLLPGEGTLDLNATIEVLRAIGYRGYLSVELFNKKYWKLDPFEVAERGMESVRILLGHVPKA